MPELLRIRSVSLWKASSSGTTAAADGEAAVREAIDMARQQGSRHWELRATNTLAARLIEHDRHAEALPILESIVQQFAAEPQKNLRDLATARALLHAAGGSAPGGAAVRHS